MMPTAGRPSSAPVVLAMCAAAAALGVPGGPASAQQAPIAPPDSGSARITGFGGLDWGSGRAAIEERWGAPDTVRPVRSLRSEALIYTDRSILEERGSMGFLVHPDSGLVRGLYLLPYRGGSDCERLYEKFRGAVGRTLGGLRGEESRVNRAEDLDFCTAFQLGRAMAQTVWRDTARGGRVWMRLDRSVGALRVSFESPPFRGLRARAQRRGTERWLGGDAGEEPDTSRIPLDSLRRLYDTAGAEPDTAGRPARPAPGESGGGVLP